jgi:hypothetical protein
MSNVWVTFPNRSSSTATTTLVLNPGDATAAMFCLYFDGFGRFYPEYSVRRTITSLPVNCVDDESVAFLCSAARVFVRPLVTGTSWPSAHRVYASPRYPDVNRRWRTVPYVLNPGLEPVRLTCVYVRQSGVVPIDLIRTLIVEPGNIALCDAPAVTGLSSLLVFGDQPIMVHSETSYSVRLIDSPGLDGIADVPVWKDTNAVYPLDCERPIGAEFFCRIYHGFR